MGEHNPKADLILSLYRGIGFDERIDIRTYPSKAEKLVLSLINDQLIFNGGQFGLQITKIIRENGAILVKFPKAVQKSIDTGQAVLLKTKSGQFLPVAKDPKTGRIIGSARIENGKALRQLGNISTLIFSAAHLISGYDNARKLSAIANDLKTILAYREHGMMAKLEAIYETLQEFDIKSLKSRQNALEDLKLELKKLRNTWFRDIEYKLNAIDDPKNLSFWKQLFQEKERGEEILDQCQDIIAPLWITRVALEMERDIFMLLDNEGFFYDQILPQQKKKIIKLDGLFKERKGWIDGLCQDGGQTSRKLRKASGLFLDSLYKGEVESLSFP